MAVLPNPASVETVGTTTVVTLVIDDATDLNAYDFTIEYDADIVRVTSTAVQPPFTDCLPLCNAPEPTSAQGQVFCTWACLPAPSPSPPVDLVQITFEGLANGTSPVAITDCTLAIVTDGVDETVPCTLQEGNVVVGPMDTPTATSTPTPPDTPPPTPTVSSSPAGSPTETPTLAVTPVATATSPPTASITPTSTAPTAPDTATPTEPGVPTDTPTATRTVTSTATVTASTMLTPSATPVPPCVGDCNGDGQVTVDDLLRMVNIALGYAPLTECPVGDQNLDGEITVNEILIGVNNALQGCLQT